MEVDSTGLGVGERDSRMMPRGLVLPPGGTDPGPLLWWMPSGSRNRCREEGDGFTLGRVEVEVPGRPLLNWKLHRACSKGRIYLAHLSPQHRPYHIGQHINK